jgi:hypothetical protein
MNNESDGYSGPIGLGGSERSPKTRSLRWLIVLFVAAGVLAWAFHEFPRWSAGQSNRSDRATVDEIKVYDRAVASLAEGSSDETVRGALETFKAAGTKAFPVLIAHMEDPRKAAVRWFQRTVFDIDPTGEAIYHLPTIGDACFDIIRGQVEEGQWLKGYQQFYVLNPDTVAKWWDTHKTRSLRDLRLECAQMSLDAARKERNSEAVDFMEKHLKQVQEEN